MAASIQTADLQTICQVLGFKVERRREARFVSGEGFAVCGVVDAEGSRMRVAGLKDSVLDKKGDTDWEGGISGESVANRSIDCVWRDIC